GMRLYLLEDKSLPVFRVSVRVNTGSYLEPSDKTGLASICGTVMRTGGTSKWTGDEIDELLEAVGGSVETSIGLESGNASINVLSEFTDLGLEVLASILRSPEFDPDKIDLAKVQERSVISRRNDDPQQITFREYKKLIYGADSPYARQIEYATINAISREDLLEFHSRYYKPQNIQMAVWGDFNKKELMKKIDKYFSDWKKEGEPVPPLPKVDYKYESKVYYINKEDVNQTNIVLGHIGGFVTDEDYGALIVMNNVLGGSMSSRLFNSVRSREGLAYAVFGVYSANIKYPGVFYNFASTKSETTIKTIREIIKEIKRMQTDPPDEKEMRGGKDGYLNSFVFKFDTKSELVNRLMNYDFNGLPEDFLFKIKEDVEKVTPEDVVAAAKNNLRPDALRILVVGKGEDFEMPLDQAGLGNVQTIDITIPSGEEKKELVVTPENIEKGTALLNKAITSAGGLDNFKKIKSVSIKAIFTISTPQGDFPLNVESIDLFPDKSRAVTTMMGQKMYQIRNGNAGWKTNQMGKLAPMTEDDIVKNDKELLRNTILIYQQSDNPSYQVVYDGSGEVEGASVEYIAITDNDGNSICRLGINQNSEVISKSYWGETPLGSGDIVEIYSGFKEIDGVKIPMVRVTDLNGQRFGKVDISEFNINSDISENAFEKPE
ncbi:MAG: M16 family metallopeptidase, partial [Candidatus Zixiibacteriota bacterium]